MSGVVRGQKLFDLLPALYRIKDGQLAQAQSLSMGPLQSLLALIEEQLAVVAEDMDQLYDDQFIETCALWVIPYIGDLIGYRAVNGVAAAVASPRAEVANTISLRRRKGTVLVLEQLARDVTGWGAHAVEFFKVLADTQYMNHIRLHNHYAPNLRRWQVRAYMNTGFDETAHTVDVRRIAVERGRYNIQNIGIFLWSLNAYPLRMSPAAAVANTNGQCFRFNSLGRDMPLFNHPVSQGSEITALARPVNVADVLLRRVLCRDIAKTSPPVYYGNGNSLALYLGDLASPVDPSKIQVCDLSGDDGDWSNIPLAGSEYSVAIDPELGRIALPPPAAGATPTVQASFYYGFNADMGGGEYSRVETFAASPEQPVVRVPGDYPSISAALSALGGDGVVEITDNAQYVETGGLNVAVNAGGLIELRAADGFRPTLFLGAEVSVTGASNSQFALNGLVVAYAAPEGGGPLPAALIHIPANALDGSANQLSQLGLTHCTLVPGLALKPHGDPVSPGQPTLLVESSGLQVVANKSILGGVWVNGQAAVNLSDSIVDAGGATQPAYVAMVDSTTDLPQPGGALTLQGCTVIGKVYASLLSLVSDCIFVARLSAADQAGSPPPWAAPLWAVRKQEGCVRFSYLPAGSVTPRQFDCVEQGPGTPQPLFLSLRYGDPAYAKLAASTDDKIRRGADDGGEMGAFHFLLAPLRETDLRVRMQEFLPVGLEFGIFYDT
jgi:hypothetical protein